MTITAEIIADSISEEMIRITTLQLRYPRFIHSEFMTHRAFSRNASSSRAVPVEKLIADIQRDTAMPMHWGKNQPGMQAKEECNNLINIGSNLKYCDYPVSREEAWMFARDRAINIALEFHKSGYHKQVVNRLLEPFSHINVVVTATEWQNFFNLRDHEDAMPEIQVLAKAIKEAMRLSEPKLLKSGEWHLPYVTEDDHLLQDEILKKISVARCARVSYLTHEGKRTEVESDIKLYEQLITSKPEHASPTEHQATPDLFDYHPSTWTNKNLFGNFYGWVQFRKTLGL